MTNKWILALMMVSVLETGCYDSHTLPLNQECVEDCVLIDTRCSFPEFDLLECQASCEEAPSNRNLMFPDCAECLVVEAQCQVSYIAEFCHIECGL
jgi:hypothetical protein